MYRYRYRYIQREQNTFKCKKYFFSSGVFYQIVFDVHVCMRECMFMYIYVSLPYTSISIILLQGCFQTSFDINHILKQPFNYTENNSYKIILIRYCMKFLNHKFKVSSQHSPKTSKYKCVHAHTHTHSHFYSIYAIKWQHFWLI